MSRYFLFALFPFLLSAQTSPFTTKVSQPISLIFTNGSSSSPTAWQPIAITSAQPQGYQITAISYSNPPWLQVAVLAPGATNCSALSGANPPSTPAGTSALITVCYRFNATLPSGTYGAVVSVNPGPGATWTPVRIKLLATVFPPSNLQLWSSDGAGQLNTNNKTINIAVQNGSLALTSFNAVGIRSYDANFKETKDAQFTVKTYMVGTANPPAPWVTVTPAALNTNGNPVPTKITFSINAAAANCQADLTAIVQFELAGSDLRGTDSLYLIPDASGAPCALAPLNIGTAAQLFSGMPNQPYSLSLAATGGTPQYQWALSGGQLPPGLSLSPGGVISGTPSASGSFNFSIQVSDSNGKVAMQTFNLIIASALAITTGLQLPPGGAGVPYSQQLSATGGILPHAWTLTAGNLPAGFGLSSAGVVSGITSNLGNYSFVARVSDSGLAQIAQSFNLAIQNALPITQTAALAHFAAGGPYVTGFFAINKSSQATPFTVAFYDNDGNPVTLPIAGQAPSSKLSATLPPNGSAYYEVGNSQSPLIGGWGQLTADPSIVVQSLFRNRSDSGVYFEAAVPSTLGSNGFQIPFDATTFPPTGERLYTGFAIANMDPARTANIVCTARDNAGNVIPNGVKPVTLKPLGHYADYLFDNLTGKSGTLDCSSNTLIGAIALRFIGNNAFSSLPVILK